MKFIHLIVGLLTIVVFLLTGQYIELNNPKLEELDNGVRMMLRSRHVYILLIGLVNLSLGMYLNGHRQIWRKGLQKAGSYLIILTPFLSIGAFFYEPKLQGLQNSLTLPAIVGVLVGVLCHLLSSVEIKVKDKYIFKLNT